MLLDDTSNRSSDAGPYVPGDIGRDSYQDHPLQDGDGYQSQNSRQAPTLTNEDSFNSGTQQGRRDPGFQEQFRKKEKGSLARQAGRGLGKAKAAVNSLEDSPENRERLKEEAKERIRKYAKDKIKDKLGEEVGDLGKDALKKAAKDSIKKAGKEALSKVGKQVGKEVVKKGAEVAANVAVDAAAEGAVAGAAIASAGPTLGLGLLIGILIEIAMYLGMSDAVDCVFELTKFDAATLKGDLEAAREHHKKARFHAQRGAMLLLMGFTMLIAIILSCSVVGWVIGVPIMFFLTLYMIAGMVFPKVGVLQGLSKKLLQALVIAYDFIAIIIFLTFAAGVLWGICSSFGLIKDGSWWSAVVGTVAGAGAKFIDWARGGDWAATFTEICGSLGKF